MGEFSAEWLALREPVDHAARSAALTRWIVDTLPGGRAVRILDLACGTGSNLRYCNEKWGRGSFSWMLVDDNPVLLSRVPGDPFVRTERRNLATLPVDLFEGQTLITASALLDLVSEPWLRALARECRFHHASVLFALTYDGRIACTPADPEDALVRELVNRHQHTDKGFGPALGPDAPSFAMECFAAAGYDVRHEPSDWVLQGDHELQHELIAGWAAAAAEIAPARTASLDAWRLRRLEHVAAGRSRILVGHQDFAAKLVSW